MQTDIIEINKYLDLKLINNGIAVFSLIITILLLIVFSIFSRYYKQYTENNEKDTKIENLKMKYLAVVSTIAIDDEKFFYLINKYVRDFLDEFKLFPGITKMTKNEIISVNSRFKELNYIAELCEKYEFGKSVPVSVDIKNELKQKALIIIKKL